MAIKDTLIYRYEEIERNVEYLKQYFQCQGNSKEEMVGDVCKSIAFYLHEVTTNRDTGLLYQKLLQYNNQLRASDDYLTKLKEALKYINVIGVFFTELPDFEEQCEKMEAKCSSWSSPFGGIFLMQSTKDLFITMKDVDNIDGWGHKKIDHLLRVIYGDEQGLNGIIPYWDNLRRADVAVLEEALGELGLISSFFKQKEDYEYKYVGAEAAGNLNKFYIAYTPIPNNPTELTYDDRIYLAFIKSSLKDLSWDYWKNIFIDCRTLHRALLTELIKKEECYSMSIPTEIISGVEKFRVDYPVDQKTAFIIMQFNDTTPHNAIVETIKSTLKKYNIIALRADDKEYTEDLFTNIKVYMHSCDFGIAVYERITEDDSNPNVALEVGYMLGMEKNVMLLKDKSLKSLQTDLVGKLYKPFDVHNIGKSMTPHIEKWLTDKGIITI
jgi:nucleoside 2-deoxyribosyltransferase